VNARIAQRQIIANVRGLLEMALSAYSQGSFQEMEDYLSRALRLLRNI